MILLISRVHHLFFLHIFAQLHICIFVFCCVMQYRWSALMGESLFLAACHDYVLSVYLLLRVFVWQNKIYFFFFFFFFFLTETYTA